MFSQLEEHITDAQVQNVLDIIKTQYQKYLHLIGRNDFNEVFAEEYAPHKRQNGVSWAISSAFPSGTLCADSLKIDRLLYGKGHTRPVLSNESIELLILNKTTHFQADYLRTRYFYNKNNFSEKKLFAYIKFSVEHRKLMHVSFCLPDETGKVVAEQVLLDRASIINLVA